MAKISKGKISLAALTTPSAVMPRMPAPYSLTDREVEVWDRITNCMAPDHFSAANSAVLAQLCRHIVSADRVAMLIESAARKKTLNVDAFAALLRAQIAESVVINRLARSMRLTQQALYRGESAKMRPVPDLANAPWVRNDEG